MIIIACIVARIGKYRGVLEKFMECQYGLLDHICQVVPQYDLHDVEEKKKNRSRQNKVLINILCARSDIATHEAFLNALRETYQMHLAAFITLDGGIDHYIFMTFICGLGRALNKGGNRPILIATIL